MVLGIFLALGIGFAVWLESTKTVPPAPAEQEPVVAVSTSTVVIATTSAPTAPMAKPKSSPKPKTVHSPGESVDQCIQAEFDAGNDDANAIFLKCLPEAASQ